MHCGKFGSFGKIKLSDLLQSLDRHHEPLIAAHVAMALECLHTRIRRLQDGLL